MVQVLEYGAPGQFDVLYDHPQPPRGNGPVDAAPNQIKEAVGLINDLRNLPRGPSIKPGETSRKTIKPNVPIRDRPRTPIRDRPRTPRDKIRDSVISELSDPGLGISPSNEKIIDDLGDWLQGFGTGLIESLNDLPRTPIYLDDESTIHVEKGIGVGHLLGDALDDIQWPDIEAPEINWPELDPDWEWPEINWPEIKPPEINWPWDWPEDDPINEPSPSPSPEPTPSPTPEPVPSPSPGVDPSDYPPGGWQPFSNEFSNCNISIYTGVGSIAVRCYWAFSGDGWRVPFAPFEGIIADDLSRLNTGNPNSFSTGYRLASVSYYEGGYLGDGQPNPAHIESGPGPTTRIRPNASGPFESRFGDYKFDPKIGAPQLYPAPPAPASEEYNVCMDIVNWSKNNPSTGKIAPVKITGYSMSCPFPIVNPPSIDDLNRPPGNAPPQSPPPLPEPPDNMNCCSCDDIKKMLRSLKGKVKVPKVTCEQVEEDGVLIWKSTIEEEEIELIAVDEATLLGIAGHYTKLAELQEAQCNARNWTDFAINVPKSVLNPPDGNLFEQAWDWITPDETLEIKTAPELIRWSIEQLSGMLGDWGQELEVPGEDGGTGKIYIPDLATGISQITLLLRALQNDEQAVVSLGTRGIFEASMARQQAIQTNYGIEAVLQCLSAKIKRDKIDVPITFSKPNPSEIDDIDTRQELENFLQNSTLPVPIIKYDDTRDLKDDLKPLLDAAGIIKAVFSIGYKQNASDEELGAMLRDLIKSHRAPVDTTRNDEDWDAWVNKVEQGFTTEPGITDPINPYGRDLTHRPRIREIGTDQADV